jgi:hypothetical protein
LSEIAGVYDGGYDASFSDATFGTSGSFSMTVKIDTKSGTATVKIGKVKGELLGAGSSLGPATLKISVSDVRSAHHISGGASGLGHFVVTGNPGSLALTMTLTNIPGNKNVRCFDTLLERDPATGGFGRYRVTFKNGKQSDGTITWTH